MYFKRWLIENESNIDSNYFQAIENNDKELLEKLVMQAAKQAGYNIGPVYHGTTNRQIDNYSNQKDLRKLVQKYGAEDQERIINQLYYKVKDRFKSQYGKDFNTDKILPNLEGIEKLKEYIGLTPEEEELYDKIPSKQYPSDYLDSIKDRLPKELQGRTSRKNWWSFDKNKLASSTKSKDAKMGFFFTDEKPFACRFISKIEFDPITQIEKVNRGLHPECMKLFLNINKPLDLRHVSLQDAKAIIDALNLEIDPKEIRADTRSSEGSKEWQKYLANYVPKLKSIGYDSVINHIKWERKRRTEYIVFEPEQIKSAEVIVKSDNGEIIPLSKRFNPSSADIRENKDAI